jgi:hypothetical protein
MTNLVKIMFSTTQPWAKTENAILNNPAQERSAPVGQQWTALGTTQQKVTT